MTFKRVISVLLILAMIFSMAACSPKTEVNQPEAGPAGSESPNKEAEKEADKYVELLRIGTTSPAESFNITVEDGSYGKMNYNSFSAAPFLELNEKGEIQPHIMTDWEVSDDRMSVIATFATDKGIMWHDGKPMTMDDIIFTFEYLMNVKKSSYLKSMSSIEKIDDTKLKLNFDTPAAFAALIKLAPFVYVYPKHIWEGVEDFKGYTGEDAVIGCGPYKLTEIDKDAQTVTYEAVDNYFKGELTVKKVLLRSYDSNDALLMALRNGEVDAMYSYSSPIDASMKNSMTDVPDMDPGASENPGNYQLVFGFNVAPTNDLPFRQAVAAALDYQLLATSIGGDESQISGVGVIAPTALGHDSSLPKNQQDIEKAKKILDDAGYVDKDGDGIRELPSGEKMSVLVTPQANNKSRAALYMRMSEIIMGNLKDIGIETVLDEESVRNADHLTEFRKSGMYELYIGYNTSGVAMYDSAFMYMVPNPKNPWGTCTDEEFNALYEEMMNVGSYEEYNSISSRLQKLADDKKTGIALSWDKAYFPYRTDKYTGWISYPGWGVINSSTWYNVRPK